MINGQTVRVDDLSAQQRRALIGSRVVACKGRNEDNHEEWAIGTVANYRPRDGIKMWVNFDCIGLMGLFPEESLVVLSEFKESAQ